MSKKSHLMGMKFQTEASEPDVLSAIVCTKSNINERGSDELRKAEKQKLVDKRIPKLGLSLFQDQIESVLRHF